MPGYLKLPILNVTHPTQKGTKQVRDKIEAKVKKKKKIQ